MNGFIIGFTSVLSGLEFIFRPKIRRFVYIPLFINILLFSGGFYILSTYTSILIAYVLGDKADWWIIVRWAYDFLAPMLTVLLYVASLLIVYFSFSTLANLIAAPFNAQLAKAVEQRLAGKEITYSEMPLMKEIIASIQSEIAKIMRFIFWALLILITLVIPVVNTFFPLIWFCLMAYNLSIQYVDYPMANHQLLYRQQKEVLRQYPLQRLGFGTAANIMVMIPVLNFIAMPVCVCGATVWWYKHLRDDSCK